MTKFFAINLFIALIFAVITVHSVPLNQPINPQPVAIPKGREFPFTEVYRVSGVTSPDTDLLPKVKCIHGSPQRCFISSGGELSSRCIILSNSNPTSPNWLVSDPYTDAAATISACGLTERYANNAWLREFVVARYREGIDLSYNGSLTTYTYNSNGEIGTAIWIYPINGPTDFDSRRAESNFAVLFAASRRDDEGNRQQNSPVFIARYGLWVHNFNTQTYDALTVDASYAGGETYAGYPTWENIDGGAVTLSPFVALFKHPDAPFVYLLEEASGQSPRAFTGCNFRVGSQNFISSMLANHVGTIPNSTVNAEVRTYNYATGAKYQTRTFMGPRSTALQCMAIGTNRWWIMQARDSGLGDSTDSMLWDCTGSVNADNTLNLNCGDDAPDPILAPTAVRADVLCTGADNSGTCQLILIEPTETADEYDVVFYANLNA